MLHRKYAKLKVRMLTTGNGRIYLTKDEYFKGGKGKQRRIMITVMINQIIHMQ